MKSRPIDELTPHLVGQQLVLIALDAVFACTAPGLRKDHRIAPASADTETTKTSVAAPRILHLFQDQNRT